MFGKNCYTEASGSSRPAFQGGGRVPQMLGTVASIDALRDAAIGVPQVLAISAMEMSASAIQTAALWRKTCGVQKGRPAAWAPPKGLSEFPTGLPAYSMIWSVVRALAASSRTFRAVSVMGTVGPSLPPHPPIP